MGLAERLLSGDSVLRASAMHEAVADEDDGRVKEPVAADRHTQRYGGAAGVAAALVQEVVSQAHGKPSQVAPPAEPERPKKEVDWGAWPAVVTPGPTAAQAVPAPPPPAPPLHDAQPAPGPPDSHSSGAELQASDLEEVEPAQPAAADTPPLPSPSSVAPVVEEDAGTRLGPEDVLPLESPSPEEQGSETRAPSVSSDDTTAVRDFGAENRRQARQFWLMVFGAFLFGMAAVLLVVVGRRAPQVNRPAIPDPQAASGAGSPVPSLPPASQPAVLVPATGVRPLVRAHADAHGRVDQLRQRREDRHGGEPASHARCSGRSRQDRAGRAGRGGGNPECGGASAEVHRGGCRR